MTQISGNQIKAGAIGDAQVGTTSPLANTKIALTADLADGVTAGKGSELIGFTKAAAANAAPADAKEALNDLFNATAATVFVTAANTSLSNAKIISALDMNLTLSGDATARSITVGSVSKVGTVRDTVRLGSATPSRTGGSETTDILLQSNTALAETVTSEALNTLTDGSNADLLHTHSTVGTPVERQLTEFVATSPAGGTDFTASTLLTTTTWTFDMGVAGRPLELEPTVVLTDMIPNIYINGILQAPSQVDFSAMSDIVPANRVLVLTTESLAPTGGPPATVVVIDLQYRTA